MALSGDVDLEHEFVAEHLAGFVTAGPGDLFLELRRHPDPPTVEEAYDGLDVAFATQGGILRAERRDFRLAVDLAALSGRVEVAAGRGALSSALRIVLSRVLPERGVALLHGAGAVVGSRTWVFFGPSGVGKSTVAAQLAAWPLLSDEIVAIAGSRPPVAFGTPFSGTLDRAGAAGGEPLGALFELAQGAALEEQALAQREAVARLMASALVFGDPEPVADALLGICRRVAEAVPVSRLALPATPAVAAFLESRAAERGRSTGRGT